MAESKKTVVQLKKEYDALAAECAAISSSLPKLRLKIEAEVKARMGDEQKKFAALKERKRQAFVAWQEAQNAPPTAPISPEPAKANPPQPAANKDKT